MVPAFATFSVAAALIVLIPGPDTLVVLRGLLLHGRRDAAMTAAGVLTGLCLWVGAAVAGLTALLKASHDGYLALRLVGGVYLIYVGAQGLRARAVTAPTDTPAGSSRRRSLVGHGYRAGLTTDLLNPKVGIFCITFLPAFIPHRAPVGPVTLAFGTIFIVETAAYFAAMLTFVDRLTRWLGNERLRRRLNRTTGVVLIGFGARLAAQS